MWELGQGHAGGKDTKGLYGGKKRKFERNLLVLRGETDDWVKRSHTEGAIAFAEQDWRKSRAAGAIKEGVNTGGTPLKGAS